LHGDKGEYFSLYIVGESTAAGEPYHEGIGLAGLIGSSFADKINGRKIRVFQLARKGESVYPQAFALEQALRLRNRNSPGVVIVYAGHNNATAKTGIPGLESFREKVLSGSVLFDYLGFYAEKYFPFFRVRTLDTYEHFMTRIVELSLKSGLTPIISTAVSNMADMDPGLRPESGREVAAVKELLAKGLALEAGGREKEALRYYSMQAEAHPRMRAYLAYRAGKCCQALRQYADAEKYFRKAVDLVADDNFGRATSHQNDFVRGLAKQYSIPLVDAEERFKERSPHGLIGNSLFSDGHHPNMDGYLILAKAFAQRISVTFSEPVRRSFSGPADVFRAFSYGRPRQAKAFLNSGRWLFNSAADHAYPRERLRLALASVQNSIKLDPDDISAWLSLGLIKAALDGSLFSDESNMKWVARNGFFTYREYDLSPVKLRGILAKLHSCGVPVIITDRISAEAAKEAAAEAPDSRKSPPARERPVVKRLTDSAYVKRSKLISDLAVEKIRAGDLRAAEGLLRRALVADRYNPEALISLCGVLMPGNEKKGALVNCKGAASAVNASRKNNIPELRMLASEAEFTSYKLLVSLGRDGEAREALCKCRKLAPRDWPGLAESGAELKKLPGFFGCFGL
jgi:tetratricopeptide (TPR) repeat protein